MPNAELKKPYPGQEHYSAPVEQVTLAEVDVVSISEAPSSFWRDSWRELRSRPMFWVSAVMILFVLLVAYVPQLFTSVDPTFCELSRKYGAPEPGHPFGFTLQGCDIYARVIYGANASVTVGILTTLLTVIIGVTVGALGGYYGGWVDGLLSRITDIFFALPMVLAAIVILQILDTGKNVLGVVAVLAVFGWTQTARIARSAVIGVRNLDYITAAKSLGASRFSILLRHVIPNAIAPVIVIATVSLGTYIVAEATLSYLGLGLPDGVISWGGDISRAQVALRTNAMVLFYPAAALAVTVLSFILLGDVVRDTLDPKSRKR